VWNIRTRLILLTLVAAMPLLVSCSSDAAKSGPDPSAAPTVAAARVHRADLTRALAVTAEFRPYQEIDVHAKVAGYVKRIYVDVGDRVKEGQLIAVFSTGFFITLAPRQRTCRPKSLARS
jgi:multidrug efflux pump subunit AcrA (membrane-fusion protein)